MVSVIVTVTKTLVTHLVKAVNGIVDLTPFTCMTDNGTVLGPHCIRRTTAIVRFVVCWQLFIPVSFQ